MNNIDISVSLISRKRHNLLKNAINSLYSKAVDTSRIEFLIRIDEDDSETIFMFKNDPFFKKIENIKIFIDPRIGYENIWRILEYFFGIARGDIFVPFADDCVLTLKNWDKIFLQYKDKSVGLGYRSRLILTKKIINENDYIRKWTENTRNADTKIARLLKKENKYIRISSWYNKVNQTPWDETKIEGSIGQWRLKDLSILDNLKWRELNIYE